MKLLKLFFYLCLAFFPKIFESLFNNVLDQDGTIFDDVGWWSRLNKHGDSLYGIDIGLCDIVGDMGANYQVVPVHGALVGSSVIVVYGGRIS